MLQKKSLFCLMLMFTLLFSGSIYAIENLKQKKILILHSDNPFLPANMVMDQKFLSVLKNSKTLYVTIYSEYLELVRFNTPKIQRLNLELMKEQYSNLNLDLIILTDDFSWDFYLSHGDELFSTTPVLFCGITDGYIDKKTIKPHVTGNFKEVDMRSSIENIMKIHPDVKEIVTLTGNSSQDKIYEEIARKVVPEYAKKVKIKFINEFSIEDTSKIISALPNGTIVLYLTIYKDGTGKTYNPRDALFLLTRNANVPVYGISDTYLNYGIVGGNLVSFNDFTNDAAEIAMQILEGKNPSEINAKPFKNKNYYDWKEMKKWNISELRLPQESIIINKPPSPWDIYRYQIILIIIIGIFALLLISALVTVVAFMKKTNASINQLNIHLSNEIAEHKNAEEKLKESVLEKETLIRELYHRTKNNMQVISSFLQIKLEYLKDEKFSDIANEIISRIQTMSLVQDNLYRSKNLTKISLDEFLRELTEQMMILYRISPPRLTVNYDLKKCEILIDSAVPLGLVINEIISNSFKHAFPDKNECMLNIRLYKDDKGFINLVIADNGSGLPDGFDINNQKTIGISTIISIVKSQMGGSIGYENNNGLVYKIAFKDNLYNERVKNA